MFNPTYNLECVSSLFIAIKMSTAHFIGILVIVLQVTGRPEQTEQVDSINLQDVKNYIQPIIYDKLLRPRGDSLVIQQVKAITSEFLADSLIESIDSPHRSEAYARQLSNITSVLNPSGVLSGVPLIPGLTGNRTGPSQAHVLGQVDRIIQNVNDYNITGIVDQALLIRAPPPVRMLVNGILNLALCNPFNRLWNRCAGGGGLLGG